MSCSLLKYGALERVSLAQAPGGGLSVSQLRLSTVFTGRLNNTCFLDKAPDVCPVTWAVPELGPGNLCLEE